VICGDDRGHMQLQAGPIIAAVYPTAAGCRRQGRRGDLLGPWLNAIDAAVGDPLILDELVPDAWYGLRQPGRRRIYEVPRAPDESLAAIAARIDGSRRSVCRERLEGGEHPLSCRRPMGDPVLYIIIHVAFL
jgi:hypothetical protein